MSLRRLSAAGLALLLPCCSPPGAVPDPNRVPPSAGTRQAEKAPAGAPDQPVATESPAPTEKETASTPEKPDALVEQAEKKAKGNPQEAMRLLERALGMEPVHRRALFLLALLTQERAYELERPLSSPLYIKSAQAIRKLREAYPDLSAEERDMLGPLLYNEACTFAVLGQPEQALDAPDDAIEAGFGQMEMIAEDEELNSIRKLPRFAELAGKVEQNAREKAGASAKKLLAETKAFSFGFELPDLKGKKVTLDDFKGKVTIVDIWGTLVPAVPQETPHFKALLDKYRAQGLAIVGINYEGDVPESDVRFVIGEYVKEEKVPYPCLIGNDKTREQIPDFAGYPTTLFLDRSGTVRAVEVGYHPIVELEAIVTLLLGEGL